MTHNKHHVYKILQSLVGSITFEDLKHVDFFLSEKLGIFIPKTGFCQYAITPMHIHPAYSFIVFLSKDQIIDPPQITVKPNCYLASAISPNVPHKENIGDDFLRYFAIFVDKDYFETQYAKYTENKPGKYCFKQFVLPKDILFTFKQFMNEYEDFAMNSPSILGALGTVIANTIIRGILDIDKSGIASVDKAEVQKIMHHIQQNYANQLTVTQLAKIVNLSPSQLTRIFKKETGQAPMNYLKKIRLECAKRLLMSGDYNITQISLKCGYRNLSHFSTSFHNQEKITPLEYKKLFEIKYD